MSTPTEFDMELEPEVDRILDAFVDEATGSTGASRRAIKSKYRRMLMPMIKQAVDKYVIRENEPYHVTSPSVHADAWTRNSLRIEQRQSLWGTKS